MSYTPTEWATGDTITAEKLNKLEGGVAGAGGVFVVTYTITGEWVEEEYVETYSADKTLEEIWAAFDEGKPVVAKRSVDENSDIYGYLSYVHDAEHDRSTYVRLIFMGVTYNSRESTSNVDLMRVEYGDGELTSINFG